MTRLASLLILMAVPCSLAMAATAGATAEDIKGILIDAKCSGKADLRISGASGSLVGGRIVAEAHTKECLLMPECEKSGYGVYTSDNKFLKFDEAGNRKALALIKASTKLDDFEVEILGEVNGDSIKVVLRVRDATGQYDAYRAYAQPGQKIDFTVTALGTSVVDFFADDVLVGETRLGNEPAAIYDEKPSPSPSPGER